MSKQDKNIPHAYVVETSRGNPVRMHSLTITAKSAPAIATSIPIPNDLRTCFICGLTNIGKSNAIKYLYIKY